jgi:hypothetical protein
MTDWVFFTGRFPPFMKGIKKPVRINLAGLKLRGLIKVCPTFRAIHEIRFIFPSFDPKQIARSGTDINLVVGLSGGNRKTVDVRVFTTQKTKYLHIVTSLN